MELFGTAGIRGPISDITPELAASVGRAVARDADEPETFVVGRDGRTSGPALAAAVSAGLESGGASVKALGVLPTPALAFASQGRRGVMVTASHNPPGDNGLKLFRDGEEYDRTAEHRIASLVETGTAPVEWDRWQGATTTSVIDEYSEAVVEYASTFGDAPTGLRVAIDGGTGVSGLVVPSVLRQIGTSVTTLNGSVDGHVPARASKPTAESLQDLRTFIADGPEQIGFGFDGDADRIVVVDAGGEVVHEDTVLAMLAEPFVRRSSAEDPVVVTTPNASARIDERVRSAGGRTERVALGSLHEGIHSVRSAGGTVVFAAEPWKHIHPAFGGWIDAVASAAVLTRLVAATGLEARREPITERPYRKRSIRCPNDAKQSVMEQLRTALPRRFAEATVTDEHGIRLTFADDSWLLVRPSGTEAYLRVYAESTDVDSLVDETTDLIEELVTANT